MIKINNKEYNSYTTKIIWGNFEVVSYGKKRIGKAPIVRFNVENSVFLGLELTFSKEMFENMNLKTKKNIKQYISDIMYEDENGWISLVDGEYDCNILKIAEKTFIINLYVNAELDELKVVIDTEIEL